MPTLALKSPTAHLLLHSGRFEVLLGPRGAGKRAFLRTLAGLVAPGEAKVFLGGVEITRTSPARRPMTFVPRGGAAYPTLTVRANLALAMRCPAADPRIDEVVAQLDLADSAERRVGELEPMLRQLVALGKAAVGAASVVLLDEPLCELDSDSRRRVRAFLRARVLAADRLLVLTCVDASEAMLLGGGVHVVDAGAVLQRGTPRSVSATPASQRVAELVHVPAFGTWPFRLAIEPGAGPVAQFGSWLAAPAPPSFQDLGPGEYRLGLPAHCVRIARREADDLEVRAVVRSLECLGAETLLRTEHDGGELAALVGREHGLVSEQAVELFFSLRDAFVFTPTGKTLRAPEREASSHAAS